MTRHAHSSTRPGTRSDLRRTHGRGTTIGVAVVRRRRLPVSPWVAATLADLGAVALLVARGASPAALVSATALHMVAAALVAAPRALERSERTLAVSMTLA